MIKVKYQDDTVEDIEFSRYPDWTFYTKWRPVDKPVRAVYVQTTTVDELTKALFLVDALTQRGIDVPEFEVPFIPGGRQDRLNDEGDFLFTARSVADMINMYSFDRVFTSDPHSQFTWDAIDNLWVNTEVDFSALFKATGYAGVIAPDKGAKDRANGVAGALGVPFFEAGKTRDVSTGALTGFTWPEFADSGRFLVVDDICDGGGTFVGLAAAAPKNIQIDLYVTHGLFTKGTDDLTKAFGNVYARFLYGSWETIIPKGVRLVGENY